MLGPAVGLSSVVAGVIVSSRVNDPRVAQQIGGIIVVPIIAVTLLQATGTLLVGAPGYLLLAVIVLIISLFGLRGGCRDVRPGGDPDALAVMQRIGHADRVLVVHDDDDAPDGSSWPIDVGQRSV